MRPAREQILSEPAGPRLNAWVAEFVFNGDPPREFACPRCGGGCYGAFGENHGQIACHGYATQHSEDGGCGWQGTWADVADMPFSHDIAAAWQVVEKWRDPDKPGGYGELSMRCEGSPEEGLWVVHFGVKSEGLARELPLAICRVALLAVIEGAA